MIWLIILIIALVLFILWPSKRDKAISAQKKAQELYTKARNLYGSDEKTVIKAQQAAARASERARMAYSLI